MRAIGDQLLSRNLVDDQQKALAMLFLAQAPSAMVRSSRTRYPAGSLADQRTLIAITPDQGTRTALAPNHLRSPPPEMNLVAKGVVAGAAIAAGRMFLKRRADKKQAEQTQVLKSQLDRQFDALDFDFGPDEAITQTTNSQASEVKSDVAAPAKVETEPKKAPIAEEQVVAKPTPRPKRVINLFKRKPAVVVPTVAELVEGDSPKAIFRQALARSLSVPMTLDVAAAVSSNTTSSSDAPAAKSASILGDIDNARKEALKNGLSEADIATCLEEVGRALVIQLVDEALDVLRNGNKEAFTSKASGLCHFARNAGTLVNLLGVAGKVSEVTYDGTRRKGQLEKLFRSLLREATPALVGSMKGMMDQMQGGTDVVEDLAPDVDFDTIQILRPVLKINEKAGERMMNGVIQNAMMKSFGSSMFGKDGKGQPDPEEALDSIQALIDSGMMGPEELDEIRKQLREQVKKESKVEVEELLRRKSELNVNQMKPEERKMFALMERLFDENAEPIKTNVDAGAEPPFSFEDDIEEEVDDGSIKVTVRPDAIKAEEVADVEEDAPSDAKVVVRIKNKDESEDAESVVADEDPVEESKDVDSVVADEDLPPTPATADQNIESEPLEKTDALA